MAAIEWQEKYSTGVDRLDEQLRKFLDMINGLHEQYPNGTITGDTAIHLSELSKFARKHFEEQEELMQQIDFPDYTAHKGEHSALRQWFVKMIFDAKGGKKLSADEVASYLGKWLIDHILKEDRRVGQAAVSKMR